jgi:hypothetical protein
VAERLKAALLKSAESKDFVGSNPTLSAISAPRRTPKCAAGYPSVTDRREARPVSPIPPAGLCETCRHSRRIEARRGAVYRLCERSATDPAYPRYPTLPVMRCPGFEPDIGAR